MPTTPQVTPFVTGSEAAPGPALPIGAGGGRPPLELHAELVYPDGTTTRWDKDSREAKDRPTGITFRTQRYTGFADAQLTLNRRIDLDYPDLGLLDGLNLIGHEGSVAYEGRIATMPRNLQSTPQVGVQAQGWMSHAKDEPFVETYVDRDLGKWVGPSITRQVTLAAGSYVMGSFSAVLDESGTMGLVFELPGNYNGAPIVDAWYDAGPGVLAAAIYLEQTASSMPASWKMSVWSCADDHTTTEPLAEWTTSPHSGYFTAEARRFLKLEALAPSTNNQGGAQYLANFKALAVYGDHGLTRRGEDPGGFYVSDIMANIAQRFASKLDTSGIQETTFAVPHAAFTSDTLPYDAFQTLNAYHRWELNVFEKRRLEYRPIDLSDYDWEVRLSDPGTTVSLQGDDTANLCNGVVVHYRDLNTGYDTRLSPDDFPELLDTAPDNPANLNGLRLYTSMTLSVPTTKEGAVQQGRAFLAEFNESQAPGTITVTGHIRDRAGHFQQVWKVRASDRIVIADLPGDRVRVVGETSYDHESKQVQISVDSSAKRLDAVLARLDVAITASGFSLP